MFQKQGDASATGYNAFALDNVKRWAKLGRSTPPEDVPTLEHWNEGNCQLSIINYQLSTFPPVPKSLPGPS